jgi:small GTP-binding protein
MIAKPDALYKVVVVGAAGVGKTSLVQRVVEDSFSDDCVTTIGVDFKCFLTRCGGDLVKLNIWDTAGQEKFRAVSRAYFRNAVGAILVYSLVDRQSFDDLDAWLNDLQVLCSANAAILLVGNKSDRVDRVIPASEAKSFAERHGLECFETSALNAANVKETFVRLASSIHDRVKVGEILVPSHGMQTSVKVENEARAKKGGCC